MEEYVDEFIRIAKDYADTVTAVTVALEEWKRQYEENQ